MAIEVKVPNLPESVTEAVLGRWHKKVGEVVRREENLVDLETDKVVLEMPAPSDGVLTEIRQGDGAKVTSGVIIAVIDPAAKAATPPPAAAPQPFKAEPPSAPAAAPLSPAVRKLVAEHELQPEAIKGTGRGGRLTKGDVLEFVEGQKAEAKPAAAARPVVPALAGERPERRVPMTRLRARIAERLKEAQNTAAILTTFNEVNMQPVLDLRARHKDRFQERYGIKLGLMSFFTRAVVEALKQFPVINASIDGEDVVYHGYYDIGIAVSSPRGLVVPVLRDVDRLGFADIEKAIADYGQKARESKLTLEDLTGGTFSITNGGVFGSLLSTPILNPPQSAILGMHKTQDRPVAEKGQVVIRPIMYLALSYDHRLVDGHEAVLFLIAIKEALEDPARMLLEI